MNNKQTTNPTDLNAYREFVWMLAHGGENGQGLNRQFMNSDKQKALIVLVELFKSATDTVRIFAANLCQNVGTESEYVEALSDFIEKNGKVRILLNAFDENLAKTSILFKRLAYYKSINKDVVVKKTTIRPYFVGDETRKEVHFTIADKKGYRIETDINQRTAKCNFNNPDEVTKFITFFDQAFDKDTNEEIGLTALFSNVEHQ